MKITLTELNVHISKLRTMILLLYLVIGWYDLKGIKSPMWLNYVCALLVLAIWCGLHITDADSFWQQHYYTANELMAGSYIVLLFSCLPLLAFFFTMCPSIRAEVCGLVKAILHLQASFPSGSCLRGALLKTSVCRLPWLFLCETSWLAIHQ